MQLTIGVHQEICSIHLLFHLFYPEFTDSCTFHIPGPCSVWTYMNSIFPASISWVSAGLHLPVLPWDLLTWALCWHSWYTGSTQTSAVKFCLVLPWIFPSRMEPWTSSFLKDSGPSPSYRISNPAAKSDPTSDLRNSQSYICLRYYSWWTSDKRWWVP